jgi:hypothetical protein
MNPFPCAAVLVTQGILRKKSLAKEWLNRPKHERHFCTYLLAKKSEFILKK